MPRHGPGEAFLKGPIPWPWISTASRLPGRALHVATALWFLSRFGPEVRLGLAEMKPSLGVRPDAARRGLDALEGAGLVTVVRREGRKPVVTIRECTDDDSTSGWTRKPLRGPIPWNWWIGACRLPGRSLQVAVALWTRIGWGRGREARFEFGLADWPDLGLSRFSAGRGLAGLEAAGLATVERLPGRKPIVTVLDHRPGVLEGVANDRHRSPDSPAVENLTRQSIPQS